MPSPACLVNGAVTTNGVNVAGSSVVTIALADVSGVSQWSISCISTDELNDAPTVTAGLAIDLSAKTATFTAPAGACALRFQSQVNRGLAAATKQVDSTLTTTFGVFVLTAGHRVTAFSQTVESNAGFGWIADLNGLLRRDQNQDNSSQGFASLDVTAGDVVLTAAQYKSRVLYIMGTPAGSRRGTVPVPTVGGNWWIVVNVSGQSFALQNGTDVSAAVATGATKIIVDNAGGFFSST